MLKELNTEGEKVSQEYAEAKAAFIKAKKILEQGELLLKSKQSDAQYARPPVRIISRAVPSMRPARPDFHLIILCSLGAAILCGFVGAAMVVAGLAMTEVKQG